MKSCIHPIRTACLAFLVLLPLSPLYAATLAVCRGVVPSGEAGILSNALIEGEQVYLRILSQETTPAACTRFDEEFAESDILWARLINPSLLEADDARIILQGLFDGNSVNVSEVIVPTPPPPPRPEAVPPVRLAEQAEPIEPVNYRSAWFWAPAFWLESPDQLWAIAERESLDRLYLTILVTDGAVRNPDALADFIAQSHDRGLSVWAVVGDRADVIEENLPALLGRASAYRQYNASHPDAPIDGLQLDIEPYLLPGFNLNQDYWRQRYIETIHAVHETLEQSLPLDLVMPVWWGNHPQWGDALFASMALPELSVTVMNYRTDFERLRVEALPFFAWGAEQGTSIHMALETGALNDEIRKHFFPDANRGELWHLEIGDYQLLLLLNSVHATLPGRAWRLAFESEFTARNLTFSGDNAEMNAIAQRLTQAWSAWPSFAGIAIHGLDQAGAETTP